MIQPISIRKQERAALSLVPRVAPGLRADDGAAAAPVDVLQAMCTLLRQTAGAVPQADGDLPEYRAGAALCAELLACADAMERIERVLIDAGAQRQRLESQISRMQGELGQAREELAGTRVEERDARHMALHDSLTDLPNRRHFVQRLEQALGDAAPRRQPLAVLYLDLDDFKPVNDTHGHATGDEMLRIIASRLGRIMRNGDMVSRLGGDEFACLLEGLTDRAQLSHMACKVIDAISAPCKIGALQLRVRPSVGIALFPEDGHDAADLLRNADTAMYNAKRHQSGYAFFDEALSGWTRQHN